MKNRNAEKAKVERPKPEGPRTPPFTRLKSHNVATSGDFEREQMGLAGKE